MRINQFLYNWRKRLHIMNKKCYNKVILLLVQLKRSKSRRKGRRGVKKILIIEDDLPIAELEKDYLELSDFDVEIEPNGTEGMKKALSGKYNVILLELVLPGDNGFEICRKFRKQYLEPVIFVSKEMEDIDKIRGLALGADDYITKPFSPSELVARVKAHLNRYETLLRKAEQREKQNEIISVGELKIDKTARRVFVGEEEKKLTTKEFDLLYFLAQNPNHAFTKEELYKKIWKAATLKGVATVTVHIKKLREKIETDTSNPIYVETVWGEGYRFNV